MCDRWVCLLVRTMNDLSVCENETNFKDEPWVYFKHTDIAYIVKLPHLHEWMWASLVIRINVFNEHKFRSSPCDNGSNLKYTLLVFIDLTSQILRSTADPKDWEHTERVCQKLICRKMRVAQIIDRYYHLSCHLKGAVLVAGATFYRQRELLWYLIIWNKG